VFQQTKFGRTVWMYSSQGSAVPAPHLNTIASYLVMSCCISRNVVL